MAATDPRNKNFELPTEDIPVLRVEADESRHRPAARNLASDALARAVIVGIEIPFLSLMGFMLKLTLASLPAVGLIALFIYTAPLAWAALSGPHLAVFP